MSDFFQFVEEADTNTSYDRSAGHEETKIYDENQPEWLKGNKPTDTHENLRQHMSEAEYAYNTCYFVNNQPITNQEATVPPKMSFGCSDEATNTCYVMPPEATKSRFISDEPSYQNSDQEPYNVSFESQNNQNIFTYFI